jgi:hypothetical protein
MKARVKQGQEMEGTGRDEKVQSVLKEGRQVKERRKNVEVKGRDRRVGNNPARTTIFCICMPLPQTTITGSRPLYRSAEAAERRSTFCIYIYIYTYIHIYTHTYTHITHTHTHTHTYIYIIMHITDWAHTCLHQASLM